MFGLKYSFQAIGVSKIGDRKCLEDVTVGKFEEKDTFLPVFDGHCGTGAAWYAHDYLWDNIKISEGFDSDKPHETMEAIKLKLSTKLIILLKLKLLS